MPPPASPLLKSGLLSLQSLPTTSLPAGRPSPGASASTLGKEGSAPLQASESRTGLASPATSAPSGERGPCRHRKRKRRTAGPWRRCLTSQTWCSWRSSHTSRSGIGSASPGAAPLLGGKSRAGAQQEMRIRSQQAGVVLMAGPLLQGLSPLEEASGRPVVVATCRPDALHGMR